MAQPVETCQTLTQQLIQRATDPFGIVALTGVISSSYSLFGILGFGISGLTPTMITQSERPKNVISETSALKLREWMYYRAVVSGPPSSPYSDQGHLGCVGNPYRCVLTVTVRSV
jgi:hypothetical protein